MRKKFYTKDDYRDAVEKLGVGSEVKIGLHRTRKLFETIDGIIETISTYFFIVQDKTKSYSKITCTYADMVCGTVSIEGLILEPAEKTL